MAMDPVTYLEDEVKRSIMMDVVRVARYHARRHREDTGHFSTPRQVFCYVDHLGYLACGDIGSTERSVRFIRDFFPPYYADYAELLHAMWRHGTIHQLKPQAYRAPLTDGAQRRIRVRWLSSNHNRRRERGQHMLLFPMEGKRNDVYLVVNSCQLADDLVSAVDAFIAHLHTNAKDRKECAKRITALGRPQDYDHMARKPVAAARLAEIRQSWRAKAGMLSREGHIIEWHPGDRGVGGGANVEPEILRRGKAFHERVQEDWHNTAEGRVHDEHTILLTGHNRRGRLDLFVDDLGDFVTVVEVKSTDWDSVKPENRKRLLSSHQAQVWRYVEEYLDILGVSVCPGIIYPEPPRTPGLREEIEAYLNDCGLQVVWYDE